MGYNIGVASCLLMQLKNDDLALILRALTYYKSNVVAHEDLVDQYDVVIDHVKMYKSNYDIES